jgi:hypothetical protein
VALVMMLVGLGLVRLVVVVVGLVLHAVCYEGCFGGVVVVERDVVEA